MLRTTIFGVLASFSASSISWAVPTQPIVCVNEFDGNIISTRVTFEKQPNEIFPVPYKVTLVQSTWKASGLNGDTEASSQDPNSGVSEVVILDEFEAIGFLNPSDSNLVHFDKNRFIRVDQDPTSYDFMITYKITNDNMDIANLLTNCAIPEPGMGITIGGNQLCPQESTGEGVGDDLIHSDVPLLPTDLSCP